MNRSTSGVHTAAFETLLAGGLGILFLGTFGFPEGVARLPRLIGGITLVVVLYSATVAWVQVLRVKRSRPTSGDAPRHPLVSDDLEGPEPGDRSAYSAVGRRRSLLLAVGLLAVLFVFPLLGLLITSLLFLAYSFVVCRVTWKPAAATMIGTGIVLYMLFGQVLRLELF